MSADTVYQTISLGLQLFIHSWHSKLSTRRKILSDYDENDDTTF